MDDYLALADRLAADIAAGRLAPGTRLPPQRRFARTHDIAASTAARVYGELVRRGLAVGEVGRGTFVRATEPPSSPALTEPGDGRVDLELNFPAVPGQARLLTPALHRLAQPAALAAALRPVGAAGTAAARDATASTIARGGWSPDPRQVLFTGNGRQAIAAAVAALVPPGERLGVEPLTYPVVKGIAARLGVTLVPLESDEEGVLPGALDACPRLRAVYLQPVLHNPLGGTMTAQRRAELAEVLRRRDLVAVEDAIYAFLRVDVPPLASLAPEHVVVVDSLSKRVGPGLTLGFVVPPDRLAGEHATAVRSGTWTAPRFALEVATAWMAEGTVAAVEHDKREDAATRQRLAAELLDGFAVRSDEHAYHCWWVLPEPWRADTFVAAAARHGIAVTPAAAFTVHAGHVPNAVRLALAAPPLDVLRDALGTLAELARGTPEDDAVE